MTATTARAGRTEQVDSKKILGAAGLAAALAVVINTLIWVIERFALGMEMAIPLGGPGSEIAPLPVLPVIIATVVPVAGAAGLLWLLNRFTTRPYTIFLVISLVFLLLSFMGPMTLPVDMATKMGLNVMHVVAGAVAIWALVTRTRAS